MSTFERRERLDVMWMSTFERRERLDVMWMSTFERRSSSTFIQLKVDELPEIFKFKLKYHH